MNSQEVQSMRPIQNSRFVELDGVWVYPEPLRLNFISTASVSKYLVNEHGYVVNLNFPEQLAYYVELSEQLGLKVRHGSLKENLKAAYDHRTKEYKEKTLVPFWVYTGEVSARLETGAVDVRRALGVKFVDEYAFTPRNQLFVDAEGRNQLGNVRSKQPIKQTQYVVGEMLQNQIATKGGYFDEFDHVPKDDDIKTSSGKGYWYGSFFDDDGFSAVGCFWLSFVGVLGAGSYGPSGSGSDGVLPLWTDENPKK